MALCSASPRLAGMATSQGRLPAKALVVAVNVSCPHDNADRVGSDPENGDPVYRCLDCGATFAVRRAYVNDLEQSYANPDVDCG